MPIYEFKCLDCQTEFEELCSFNTVAISCPKCASGNTKRKISVFCAKSVGSEGTKSVASGHSCGSCHSGNCHSCH